MGSYKLFSNSILFLLQPILNDILKRIKHFSCSTDTAYKQGISDPVTPLSFPPFFFNSCTMYLNFHCSIVLSKKVHLFWHKLKYMFMFNSFCIFIFSCKWVLTSWTGEDSLSSRMAFNISPNLGCQESFIKWHSQIEDFEFKYYYDQWNVFIYIFNHFHQF